MTAKIKKSSSKQSATQVPQATQMARAPEADLRKPPDRATDNASFITGGAVPAMMLVGSYLSPSTDSLDILNRLYQQADALLEGDMSQVQTMLLHQAVALQAMFVDLALRAKNQDSLPAVQTLTQLAPRAQSGSRATLQTLAEVKHPRQVAFVRQTNVAQTQQVNNGVPSPATAPARQVKPAPNELIAQEPYGSTQMDTPAEAASGRADPELVAVDEVDRTAKRRRQEKRLA